ncbi:MAG: hypothetical protein PQJ60_10200 [Spirochaetales bacterium]|nr:hypothetical protein [Spirochaetales bacterium]
MKRQLTLIFFIFPLLLFADELRVEPLEFWQNGSSWPETLSVDQLVEASLRASGVDELELGSYLERFDRILGEFREEMIPALAGESERRQGEAVLEWMHSTLLTGHYRTDQTKIDVLMDRGDYNCVSSALVYLILTREAGLDTKGEETADHAFCTLGAGEEIRVDVETTTLLGFDPGTKKEFTQSFSGRTGFAYVEPGDYRRRKPASDKRMVSLILQNRIALYQRQGRYEEAVGPAVDRWFFLPSEDHRKDMNDAFRNYVSLLNGQGRFEEALDFLLPLSRELDLVEENEDLIAILAINRVITLVNQDRTEEGEEILREWEEWLPADQVAEQRRIIYERRAQAAVDGKSYPEALEIIRAMGRDGSLSPARLEELITWLHQNRALEMLRENDPSRPESYRLVLQFFDGLPEGERNYSGIVDHRARHANNWAVLVHNRFADLVNRGEYDRAKVLLDEALRLDGSSPMLREDRAFLDGLP